jgi:hypothetical protein
MKIILSLLLLVFAALLYIEPVFAQNDISQFAEENTIWSIGVFGYMNNFNTVYSTYYLKIQGDTAKTVQIITIYINIIILQMNYQMRVL